MNRMFGWMLAGVMTVMSGSAFAAQVDRRQLRQEARIEQGVRSGALSAREAMHLQRNEARLRREIRRDRMRGAGMLSVRERMRINRQENQLSRRIDREKHNRRRM